MKTLYNKIIELDGHYSNLDSEIGIFNSDNSQIIFSNLNPSERGKIMNLVRDRNFSSKMLSGKELRRRINLKIKEIING
jgi:hypothetical protein